MDKFINFPEKADRTFTYIRTGAAGMGKGSLDIAEVIASNDGICAAVSTIGIAADPL